MSRLDTYLAKAARPGREQNEPWRFLQPNPQIPHSREPLAAVPRAQWPSNADRTGLVAVFLSRAWLVQIYDAGGYRVLRVNRTKLGLDGRTYAGITWDDLQWIKRAAGYGAQCAVEVFPPDAQVVDLANMRHLVLLPEVPPYCWDGYGEASDAR